jgi:hypothetical protein
LPPVAGTILLSFLFFVVSSHTQTHTHKPWPITTIIPLSPVVAQATLSFAPSPSLLPLKAHHKLLLSVAIAMFVAVAIALATLALFVTRHPSHRCHPSSHPAAWQWRQRGSGGNSSVVAAAWQWRLQHGIGSSGGSSMWQWQ